MALDADQLRQAACGASPAGEPIRQNRSPVPCVGRLVSTIIDRSARPYAEWYALDLRRLAD